MGSANLMLLPSVADSLAGRLEIINLFPFSQSEIFGISENWLDSLFSGRILKPGLVLTGKELHWAVLQGEYYRSGSEGFRNGQEKRSEGAEKSGRFNRVPISAGPSPL